MTFDAVVVVSFGGPEGPDDVMPFLERVVAGKRVPRERLLEVAEHYQAFGGKSPINDQNRALVGALKGVLKDRKIALPVYLGNRNWHPLLKETCQQMKDEGVKNALAFITSAYGSYSGCRQYREDIAAALIEVPAGPSITPMRKFFNHPGFVLANVDRVQDAKREIGSLVGVRLVFTAHSIPISMATSSPYEEQLQETARLVAKGAKLPDWDLVWQSRSGPPTIPWLKPDILDHLRALKKEGVEKVIISPIGFVSDHMEVIYDLDHEAKDLAKELGMTLVRAASAGTHPRFVGMVADLVEEHLHGKSPMVVGNLALAPNPCREGCCPKPLRRR